MNANLLILFAVVGFATMATWIVRLADELLDRFKPKVLEAFDRWKTNRALGRLLKHTRPASAMERRAMQEGARQAMAAFARAQAAALEGRRGPSPA